MAQKENQVKCTMKNVPSTKMMNDRDYLNDILATEKSYTSNMAIFLNEASNETLYNNIDKMFKKIKQSQRDLFELAWSNGWYTLESAEKTKIKTKKNEFKTKLNELN